MWGVGSNSEGVWLRTVSFIHSFTHSLMHSFNQRLLALSSCEVLGQRAGQILSWPLKSIQVDQRNRKSIYGGAGVTGAVGTQTSGKGTLGGGKGGSKGFSVLSSPAEGSAMSKGLLSEPRFPPVQNG